MSTHAVEQVDDWDAHPFSGGYRGLHDLADERFSGVVTVGPTRLCMTKGTVVGILDGDIEAFEDASGTVHEAPSPALPLLAVMQDGSDEVQARYYTEETPIREVDATLSDGNFTGFIELSENVLSGDYYTVYHQGRSMSVAFVGNAKRLLVDEEAFERANDEVGIYEVKPADIEVVEIPEVEAEPDAGVAGTDGAADAAGAADAPADDATATDADADPVDEPDAGDGTADVGSAGSDDPQQAAGDDAAEAGADTGSDPADDGATATDADDDRGGSSERGESGASSSDAGPSAPPREESGTETGTGAGTARSTADSTTPERSDRQPGRQGDSAARAREERTGARNSGSRDGAGAPPTRGQSDGSRAARDTGPRPGGERSRGARGTDAVGDLETRSIPSLDPSRTSTPDDDPEPGAGAGPDHEPEPRGSAGVGSRSQPRRGHPGGPGGSGGQPAEADTRQGPRTDEGRDPGQDAGAATAEEVAELESDLEDREAEIDRLETELEDREERVAELESDLEAVRAERDELAERVEDLEARVDDLRTESGGESVADRRRMSPGEAIDGTNLFIRYASKGDATLEKAYGGAADRDAVNENLAIQHHTQFEADDVAVGGEPFREFLEDTIQFAFVEWVVRVLPYEIRDTGRRGELKDLYEALPKVDRAELNGAVSVVYEEEGAEQRGQERFDIVLRDRMGNPLVVANLNESRDPASQGMMESLISAAERVGESKQSLAGAFLVTSSFFEPEAMEAASQATGGGLLSRDKRESFVKLSRKEGFHLCLVEARDAQFNLSVPEI